MVSQKEISKYIRRVGKGCQFSFRRKMIMELQNNLSDFLDGHPECTMDDVLSHFGTPEKFADEYILAMEVADRQKILRKTKLVKKGVCTGVAMVILIVMATAILIVHENSQSVGDYYTDVIHVLE